ncbi:MAG: hypothetical protein IH852_14385 [Bacteroidetes bacterium]|nr:hypothetical protein [Bacteroidota bacterium]
MGLSLKIKSGRNAIIIPPDLIDSDDDILSDNDQTNNYRSVRVTVTI